MVGRMNSKEVSRCVYVYVLLRLSAPIYLSLLGFSLFGWWQIIDQIPKDVMKRNYAAYFPRQVIADTTSEMSKIVYH